MTAETSRPGPLHVTRRAGKGRPKWRAYLALTKPRIIRLLLVTTVPTMMLAAGGWPDTLLVVNTVVGGALAAGSASAFNMYFDRDIDKVMQRTQERPLVTGEISPRGALVFASVLAALSLLWLACTVNLLATALTAVALLLYVVLYTLVLKRRTDQNIIWGGSAGCMPVLIGWAAVTDSVALAPILLFLVVFFWTPAHYWPLSLTYEQDYSDAGVPMLSVTRSHMIVARRSAGYAVGTVATALIVVPVSSLGWIYGVSTAIIGAWFVGEACALVVAAHRSHPNLHARALRTFHASITFLAVVFLVIVLDSLL